MWDKNGYLRDWRNPTPGPIEALAPQRADRVTRRYVYGGGQLVQRETYRDRGAGAPEITRTIQTAPGTSAPVAWLDSDGVIDVLMKDRQGMPLWTYRARAGRRWFDASGPDEYKGSGSGILAALPLPGGSRYLEYPAWHLRAIEGDYLMGRRGILGWRGTFDVNLLIGGPMPAADLPASEQDRPWWHWAIAIGGAVVAVVGGVVLIVASAGMATPGVIMGWGQLAVLAAGTGLTVAGLTAGVSMIAGNDPLTAAKHGGIAGVATAAAVFTGGAAYAGVGAFLLGAGSATPMLPTLVGAGLLQSTAAMSLAGIAGGYVGGQTYGILETKMLGGTWDESVAAGQSQGTMGAYIGAAMPWVALGARGVGHGAARVHRGGRALGRGRVAWRIQRYGKVGRGGLNKVNLATGKRVPTGVVTGVDVHPVIARGGTRRPWYWRSHFHAGHPTARFGASPSSIGRTLQYAHLPWEGLGAWYRAFPVKAPLVTAGAGATVVGGAYGVYQLVD